MEESPLREELRRANLPERLKAYLLAVATLAGANRGGQ